MSPPTATYTHKPTVLHLLDTEAFAGTERHVLELIKALSQEGMHAILGCRVGSELEYRAKAEALNIRPCWSKSGVIGLVGGLMAIRKLVATENIDLIHAHNGRTSLIATCVNLITGTTAVATQHFIDPQFTTYRGIKRIIAAVLHNWVNYRLSAVLCVSQAARQSLLRREKILPSKVRTLPNGISKLKITSKEDVSRLRAEFGVSSVQTLIVAVCRLEPEKGIEFLLQAMALLQIMAGDVKLVIAGEGSQRKSLEDEAKRLSLHDAVTFLGFRDDISSIVAAADIFVLPSPAEPFGLAVLEAMSVGKPIVACNAGGPAEILTDGVDGLLVTPADAAALADALTKLKDDPEMRDRMGGRALVTYSERYTAEIMGENMLAIYRSIPGFSLTSVSNVAA